MFRLLVHCLQRLEETLLSKAHFSGRGGSRGQPSAEQASAACSYAPSAGCRAAAAAAAAAELGREAAEMAWPWWWATSADISSRACACMRM